MAAVEKSSLAGPKVRSIVVRRVSELAPVAGGGRAGRWGRQERCCFGDTLARQQTRGGRRPLGERATAGRTGREQPAASGAGAVGPVERICGSNFGAGGHCGAAGSATFVSQFERR